MLLKNDGGTAAAEAETREVYVAGSNADDIGNQAGGWTLDLAGRRPANIDPGHDHPRRHPQVAPRGDR